MIQVVSTRPRPFHRAVGARLGEANTLRAIGDVQQFRKDTDAALASYDAALVLFRAVGARIGEANTLAALACLGIDQHSEQSQRVLEQAITLRRAMQDFYNLGADLANYGLALVRCGRQHDALAYLHQARAIFAEQRLHQQVQQIDTQLAQLSGEPDPTTILIATLPPAIRTALTQGDSTALHSALAALPEAEAAHIVAQLQQAGIIGQRVSPATNVLADLPSDVRAAIEQQDSTALAAALATLPEDEAAAIVAQIQQVGIIGQPVPPPDMERVRAEFAPLIQAIAAVAQGDETPRAEILAVLPRLEEHGWQLNTAVMALWAGERDRERLTAGVDPNSAELIDTILTILSAPETTDRDDSL